MARRFKTDRRKISSVGRVAPEIERRNGRYSMAKRLRSSARWQKCRLLHLNEHPLCCDPLGEHAGPEPADQVHHIIPVFKAPELLCEASNLASICTACHSRIEAKERAGTLTHHLFKGVGGSNHKNPFSLDRSGRTGETETVSHISGFRGARKI